MNWFGVLKNQARAVNLPKFKVKPFDKPKVEGEETRCKDKIMELYNTAKRFQPPTKISEEYDSYKPSGTGYITYYHKEDAKKFIRLQQNVHSKNVDLLPEEAYCRLLDLLQEKSNQPSTKKEFYYQNFYANGTSHQMRYENFLKHKLITNIEDYNEHYINEFNQYFFLTDNVNYNEDRYIKVELGLVWVGNDDIPEGLPEVIERMKWSI
tara:strand:+ start:255 stop:881 length:627 start_codon:yes stop_codon:yes gene_type:complete